MPRQGKPTNTLLTQDKWQGPRRLPSDLVGSSTAPELGALPWNPRVLLLPGAQCEASSSHGGQCPGSPCLEAGRWGMGIATAGVRGGLAALPHLENRAGAWGLRLQQPLRGPPPRLLPSAAEPAGCAGPGGPPSAKVGRWHPSRPRRLLEESFVTKDPFTPDKDRFLILGSKCSVCGRRVCVGPVGKPRATGRLPWGAGGDPQAGGKQQILGDSTPPQWPLAVVAAPRPPAPDGDLPECSWGALQGKQPHFPELVGCPAFSARFTPEAALDLPQSWAGRASSGRRVGAGPGRPHSEPSVCKPKGALSREPSCLGMNWGRGSCVPGHSQTVSPSLPPRGKCGMRRRDVGGASVQLLGDSRQGQQVGPLTPPPPPAPRQHFFFSQVTTPHSPPGGQAPGPQSPSAIGQRLHPSHLLPAAPAAPPLPCRR